MVYALVKLFWTRFKRTHHVFVGCTDILCPLLLPCPALNNHFNHFILQCPTLFYHTLFPSDPGAARGKDGARTILPGALSTPKTYTLKWIATKGALEWINIFVPETKSVKDCCAEVILDQNFPCIKISHKVYKKSICSISNSIDC